MHFSTGPPGPGVASSAVISSRQANPEESPLDVRAHSRTLVEELGLRAPPVAVAFRADVPADMERTGAPAPAGCGYWRMAAEGRSFGTVASDHYGCPVGAHTHGVALPPEKQAELQGLIGTMVGLEYL